MLYLAGGAAWTAENTVDLLQEMLFLAGGAAWTAEYTVDQLLDMLYLAGGAGLGRILRYQGFKRFCSSDCACGYLYSRTKGNGLRGGNCKNILFVLKHNSSTFISQIKTFFIYIFPPVRECMQNIQQILSLSRLFPLERVPLDAKLSLFLL